MKKLLLFSALAVTAALGLTCLAGIPAAQAVPPAPLPEHEQIAANASVVLDAAAEIPAAATASAPLFAVKPDTAFHLTALAICLLAVLALARGVKGAHRLSLPQLVRLSAAIALNALDRIMLTVFPMWRRARALGVDDWTMIGDLWVPEVLVEGMQEKVVENTSFLDSGVVVESPLLAKMAEGPGTEATFPFLVEPNHDDQLQIEDTAPDIKAIASGSQKAAFFNRVSTLGTTALAGIISGVKPGGDLLSVLLGAIQGLRKKQRNRLVLAQLKGLFATSATPDQAVGAFRALRKDYFLEAGASPTDDYLIDSTKMLYACALLGEAKEMLIGGVVIMHSVIEAALVDQEQIDVIKNSEGEIVMRRWKGLQVFISDQLVRNGASSGKVYFTFFLGRGSIATGEKTQKVGGLGNPVIDAASLNILGDVTKNNASIYDRTRFLLHPQGAKWVVENEDLGEPTAGPDNTEVATAASWDVGAANIKNTRIVCLRTNG